MREDHHRGQAVAVGSLVARAAAGQPGPEHVQARGAGDEPSGECGVTKQGDHIRKGRSAPVGVLAAYLPAAGIRKRSAGQGTRTSRAAGLTVTVSDRPGEITSPSAWRGSSLAARIST